MRFICFLFVFIALLVVRAQTLVVSVKDVKTNEPIPNVRCSLAFLKADVSSNLAGISLPNWLISFDLKDCKSLTKLNLYFTHPIYQGAHRTILFDPKQDTTQVLVYLKAERVQEVREVVLLVLD